jgi:hypothetical protein
VLEEQVVQAYAGGLSVRNPNDALRDGSGDPLSYQSAVSGLRESLWEHDDAFWQRGPSSLGVEHLVAHAIFEGLRDWRCRREVLGAWDV